MKTRVAIIGFGNIGKFALEAVNAAGDFELAGIVSRSLAGTSDVFVSDITDIKHVDAAILCSPSRAVPDIAEKLVLKGISCADSYDIHDSIYDYKIRLDAAAKKGGAKAVISAGWDPGTDSIVRALMLAMAPKGLTYTNFGPGMSMGHSVCAKGKTGVRDALSMTMPKGDGVHRRMVYIELSEGADFSLAESEIKADPYFSHDETHVIAVPCVDALKDMGHGVTINRKGVSGKTQNQIFTFDMRINNPALTAQILVSSLRAALKQNPGAYTTIELPLIDWLEGTKEDLIRSLV